MIDRDTGQRLLRNMLRIRRMEERCAELYTQQKIRGFLHLYIGEEAVGTGLCDVLREDDDVFATYREHGHALLRGVSMDAIMAEMMGKQEGCSRGRGGSMHLFDEQHHFHGGSAIVAGHLPLAVGMALSHKVLGRDRVVACFFGEGAVAEGDFHEALNLAALWRVPVLFACENNGYAMGTALHRSEAQTALTAKAAGYNVPAESVDGMDVLAVREATARAVALVRLGEPFLLELKTYRFRPHSMFDPMLYRDKAEVEEWKKKDPVETFRARLLADGLLDDAGFAALEAEVAREVEAAVAFGEAGTWEPVGELLRDVLTPRGGA